MVIIVIYNFLTIRYYSVKQKLQNTSFTSQNQRLLSKNKVQVNLYLLNTKQISIFQVLTILYSFYIHKCNTSIYYYNFRTTHHNSFKVIFINKYKRLLKSLTYLVTKPKAEISGRISPRSLQGTRDKFFITIRFAFTR